MDIFNTSNRWNLIAAAAVILVLGAYFFAPDFQAYIEGVVSKLTKALIGGYVGFVVDRRVNRLDLSTIESVEVRARAALPRAIYVIGCALAVQVQLVVFRQEVDQVLILAACQLALDIRAAYGARCLRTTRALRIGESFHGMGDFDVAESIMAQRLGVTENVVEMQAMRGLRLILRALTESQIQDRPEAAPGHDLVPVRKTER